MTAKRSIRWLLGSMVLALLVFLQAKGWCRDDVPAAKRSIRIVGEDHLILKRYFSSVEPRQTNRAVDEQVKDVLLRNLLSFYASVCSEGRDGSRDGALPALGGFRILFVESDKEERPSRVLLTWRRACRTGEDYYQNERLASLVIEKEISKLTVINPEPYGGGCAELVEIAKEKEVHIGGKSLVGLDFVTLNNDQYCPGSRSVIREERIKFFLFDEGGMRPAGSVLKTREEAIADGDRGQLRTTYGAGIVFRKDMKGNIIGILSPYTIKSSDGRSDRGMLRFSWDEDRAEFVPEKGAADSGQVAKPAPLIENKE